jgi:hypothetical protein
MVAGGDLGLLSAMASSPSIHLSPGTVSPVTARKTWRTAEPLHGMIYFAPEATESYASLGIPTSSGYFASRSAPMGQVGADVVIATFFNFHPRVVRPAIPAAWKLATPEAVLEARVGSADAALRRMLGEAVDSPDMVRAAGLARAVAERAADCVSGRPLFAGHAGLPWPDAPHLVLWHAQTCLREFRGDGHIAALLLAEIGPVEALIVHVASGEVPIHFLKSSRGWSDEEWDAGVDQVRSRGWLEDSDGSELTLSESGKTIRQRVEDETDVLAVFPYGAIGEDGCAELRTLTRPFSRAVVAAAGLAVATNPPPSSS